MMDKLLLLPGTVPGSHSHPPNQRTRAPRKWRSAVMRACCPGETTKMVFKNVGSTETPSNVIELDGRVAGLPKTKTGGVSWMRSESC
jgi:hypothetical protein